MNDNHTSKSGSEEESPSKRFADSEIDQKNPEGITSKEDLEDQTQRLPYPKSVFFIVSNEFCERFSCYGMRTILSLYLKNQLKFTENSATVIFHVFLMICYFFPVLGAIVADSWLGKYRTILYLSIVYALGNVVVSTAAIPNTLPQTAFTMLGLVLIALGTGGIKPCVAAFGGDQFKLPEQQDQLKKFFSVFYFAINMGSFVSTFLTPLLREVECFGQDSCYSLAFGVPALLMILSIVIYIAGKSWYVIKEPEGNVVVRVAQCMWYATTKKSKEKVDHWLDKARDKYEKGFIDDIKATLRVLVLYIPIPIFWALFDQQSSRWTFQASRMNGEIGSFKIQPDQMQVVNPLLILAFIPVFDSFLYPTLAKCNLLKRPLQRLTVGGILAALAFGISAIVEIKLEPTYAVLPKAGEAQLRIYNGLPGLATVEIPEIKEKFELNSLAMWEKLDIPVSGQKSLVFTYKSSGQLKQDKISLYENEAISYTITPKGLLQIRGEDTDKSDNGNPKVEIIYSDGDVFEKKTVTFSDSSQETSFVVTKGAPYTNFTKIPLSSDKYTLKVDGVVILTDIEFKQGGVYSALISKFKEGTKASITTVTKPNTVHMMWLVPQYVIMTAGEIMLSITGLEFSYSQAPVTMKSLLQAAWLLNVAVGNLIVVIIAEAKLFERQTYEFILFASLMLLDMLAFAFLAMRYTYVEDMVDNTKKDENNDSDPNKLS